MAEYIGMNKLKWLLLAVYGLYIILLRIPKLAILYKLPIKKDIYIYIELVFWFRKQYYSVGTGGISCRTSWIYCACTSA